MVSGSGCETRRVCGGSAATDVNALTSACGVQSEKLGSVCGHFGSNKQLSGFAGVSAV